MSLVFDKYFKPKKKHFIKRTHKNEFLQPVQGPIRSGKCNCYFLTKLSYIPQQRLRIDNDLFIDRPYVPTYTQ